MSRIKLITLDLDNTLWPVDEVIRRAEQECMVWIHHHHPDAADALSLERIRAIRQQLLTSKPGYRHNLTALRKDALARGFQESGYSAMTAANAAREAFDVFHQARNEVVFFPGALDLLEALADAYILGALSNGNADLKKIGIDDLFAFHHTAESVGERKPAPAMFHAALASARAKPHQALHIGDHPEEDVDAARRLSIGAVWANLLNLEWPDGLEPHEYSVHNLHEVLDLLPLLDD